VGERICAPLKSFRFVLPIIRHHHEKLDGSGYPDGLRGDAIPAAARVLQIVDVYDALTTVRPYKRAFSITDALQTMKQEVAKGWWDPHIFDQFERLIRGGTADFLSRSAAAGG
jgi:putative two-component system response regulator